MASKTARKIQKLEIDLRLRLHAGEDIALGPGKVDLLEAIAAAGSISGGARQMGMSYRRAWLLVETMNRAFGQPLVRAQTGGNSGGGAAVTKLGLDAIKAYRELQRAAEQVVQRGLPKLKRRLSK
ncbi:MAG: LysR family transcriptional regulator [Rhodospirillales bacterium]